MKTKRNIKRQKALIRIYDAKQIMRRHCLDASVNGATKAGIFLSKALVELHVLTREIRTPRLSKMESFLSGVVHNPKMLIRDPNDSLLVLKKLLRIFEAEKPVMRKINSGLNDFVREMNRKSAGAVYVNLIKAIRTLEAS